MTPWWTWLAFQFCNSGLHRSRGKTVPKLPITQKELILQDPWTQTLARERFLLSDDSDDAGNRIIVFAIEENLQRLCASSTVHVYSDITLYSSLSSTHFTQMMTKQSSLLCLISLPTRLNELTGASFPFWSQQWTIASLCLPPESFDHDGPRTTNVMEGWHHKIKHNM